MTDAIIQPCAEGVIRSGACTEGLSTRTKRWILAAAILSSAIVFLNASAISIALPQLQSDMGATIADIQWIVNGYMLFLASLMLLGGSLGDHLGRRKMLLVGTAVFGLASIWAGVAPDVGQLIAARALQGVGGALLTPVALAIIGAAFPENERGPAIGVWAAFGALAAAGGPLLGGYLAEAASWRWIFLINVPLAGVVIAIAFWRVPESRDEEETSGLDWWGATLTILALAGITYGLIEAPLRGLADPLVLGSLAGGTIFLIGFVLFEAKGVASPMMPLGLFRSRSFTATNLLTLFLYGGFTGVLFVLPFNLIQVQGYSPTMAGLALMPIILIVSALSRWAGGLVPRFGARWPLTVGPLLVGAGFALLAIPGAQADYWTSFFPGLVISGLGMAITVAPLTTTVLDSVPRHQAGLASGINNAASRLAGLVAVALLGIVLVASFNQGLDERVDVLELSPAASAALDAQRDHLAAAEIPAGLDAETGDRLKAIIADSYLDGFRLVILLAAAMSLLGGVTAWILIDGKSGKAPAAAAA